MLGFPFGYRRGTGSSRTRGPAADTSVKRRVRHRATASCGHGGAPVEAVERRVLFASLWISDAVVTEGSAGTTDAVFTVRLFQPNDQPVTVNYTTSNNTATTPDDYAVRSGTLTFAPGGPTTQTVTVPVVPDTLQENNESFFVTLGSPTNANIVGAEGRGYIADDDQSFLTIHNLHVSEGSGATPTNAVLTVTRSGSTAGTSTVNYATAAGTATSPSDFTTTSGTLEFGPGVTSRTVTVPVAADFLDEANETLTVTLTGAVNSTPTASSATVTIVDNDASYFTIDGVAVQEGSAQGASTAVVTVTRHGALGGPASVAFATANSSAVAGEDFTQSNGTLQFAAGDPTEQITIPITSDAVQELTQYFSVNLSNAQNATLSESSADVYVIDDDASSFVIEGAAVMEGDAGTTPLNFTVRRYGSLLGAAVLNYATTNSTAAAPGDYAQVNGTVTFAPGEAVKTIPVQVAADNVQEATEQFFLTLSNSTNGTIAETQAVGLIVDDDESYFTIASTAGEVVEGDAGTTGTARFVVTRHGSLDGAANVNFATANGSAATPADYAVSNGSLAFAAGETSKEITVTVNGDATTEGNENFSVNLSGAQNATIAENSALGWIVNDDGAVATSFFFPRDVVVTETDAGNVTATFVVRRFGATAAAATVNYTTNNGTAVQSQDFQGAAGTLQFAPGDTEESFTVTVLPDGLDEQNETFTITLGGAVGGTVADASAQATIIDDDAITLYVNDVSTQEGDDPAGREVRYTVTRFGETGGATTVNFTTTPSTATTPGDYLTASGNLSFAPGEASKELVVRVVGDAIQEPAEQYTVTLSSPVNGTVIGSTGQGMIVDDDESVLYVNDVSVTEGTAATPTSATFTVTRFGSTDGTTSVQYTALPSSATAPDFATASGTLTFVPGEATKQLTVPVVADSLQEAFESFLLDLTLPQNGTVVGGRGSGDIVDDDTSFVGLTGTTVTEGSAGTTQATHTLYRFGATGGESSVEFRTGNSTATSPADYAQLITTVTFAPGESTRTVSVPVVADTLQEANEGFNVSLAAAQNTTVFGGAQTTYIIDDDEALLYVTSEVVIEGNPDAPASLVFTVRRLGSTAGTTMVNYAAANSTATAPSDYAATSGTLTFAPGVATQTVTVPVTADLAREPLEETLLLNLSGVQNGTVVAGQAQGTILDDDPAPAVARVYFSSTDWVGVDNNTNAVSFKEYLQSRNLGSIAYGYAIPDGAAQLVTLPWLNLNQLSITFTHDVILQKDDLAVRGTNVANYGFLDGAAGFTYNATTRTATWTFDAPLAKDRIILDLDAASPNGVRNAGGEFLDGEWANGSDTYPSGNGSGGGDFLFRLNVLPGDTYPDNAVLARDFADVKKKFFKSTDSPVEGTDADYSPFHDVEGSGIILAFDFAEVKKRFFDELPPTQPASVSGLFGDAPVGDGSHRDLLA